MATVPSERTLLEADRQRAPVTAKALVDEQWSRRASPSTQEVREHVRVRCGPPDGHELRAAGIPFAGLGIAFAGTGIGGDVPADLRHAHPGRPAQRSRR